MDHYSAERWILERHRTMERTAERRARLTPAAAVPAGAWMAALLRALADRLDGQAALDGASRLTSKELS